MSLKHLMQRNFGLFSPIEKALNEECGKLIIFHNPANSKVYAGLDCSRSRMIDADTVYDALMKLCGRKSESHDNHKTLPDQWIETGKGINCVMASRTKSGIALCLATDTLVRNRVPFITFYRPTFTEAYYSLTKGLGIRLDEDVVGSLDFVYRQRKSELEKVV